MRQAGFVTCVPAAICGCCNSPPMMVGLDLAKTGDWLRCPASAAMQYPDVQAAIVDWIDNGMATASREFSPGPGADSAPVRGSDA